MSEVSLSVDAGQFVLVRGASGCGKTTLLLTLGAMLAPDSGRVEVGGTDPYTLNDEARAGFRATRLGFVFQQFYLIPYLNVRENVACAAVKGTNGGGDGRVEELIARFGLEGRLEHRPAELSTGEKQRVALARALLNRPRLVLADEPTGNLDEANAQTVVKALKDYAREDGAAVLMVTHDPRWEAAADRIVCMEYGRVL
ncbi:MAG: ABC transporter ATP-binding protein [bacterium]|nr:ABC transporter ATP-binding protein [bacterium]